MVSGPPPAQRSSDLEAKASASTSDVDFARFTRNKTPWARRVMPFERIVEHEYQGKGTAEEPYLVIWLDGDAEDPFNKSSLEKWTLAVFVSVATLAVALASSIYSGCTAAIAADLGGSDTVITLGISLFVLGFALGPLIWGPLSEMTGRRNLFLISYSFFTLWNGVAIASPNLAALLVFRFLAGAFGSSPLANAGGTIADVFRAKERGLAMAVFALAPFLGPSLGPISGGFLSDGVTNSLGPKAAWQWVLGLLTIFAAIITLLGFFVYSETYAPVLLRQRAQTLQRATGKHYISKLDLNKNVSIGHQLKVALSRPWQLLFYEPIVLLLSLYVAVIYGILYSFFAAFPIVFQEVRGWSPGIGGLAFLGLLVGMVMAILYVAAYVNPKYSKTVDEYGGIMAPPESRLPPSLIGAPLLVFGLAGFAATDFPSIHWIVPILFSAPIGAAIVLLFLALQNYLIDSYLLYAASVLAANSVIRSTLGAAFVLFTKYMYSPGGLSVERYGIHIGPAIAAGLSLLFLPFPFLFYRRGAAIRERCKYSAEANKLLQSMYAGTAAAPTSSEKKVTSDEQDVEASAPSSTVQEHNPPVYRAATSVTTEDEEERMRSQRHSTERGRGRPDASETELSLQRSGSFL